MKTCLFCNDEIRTDRLCKHFVEHHVEECLKKYPKDRRQIANERLPILRCPQFTACLVCKTGVCNDAQRYTNTLEKWNQKHRECWTEANWLLHQHKYAEPLHEDINLEVSEVITVNQNKELQDINKQLSRKNNSLTHELQEVREELEKVKAGPPIGMMEQQRLHMATKELKEEIEQLKKKIETKPKSSNQDIHVNELNQRLKNHDEVLKEVLRLITLLPEHPYNADMTDMITDIDDGLKKKEQEDEIKPKKTIKKITKAQDVGVHQVQEIT
jgi:hypothetical protein